MTELLLAYGRARNALFQAHRAWEKGKPESGPIAEAWHRSRTEHSMALAALNIEADALASREVLETKT